MPTSRGIRPPTIFLACKLREKSSIVELVLRLSEHNNHLNRVGVDLPDEIVMFLQTHCHQAVGERSNFKKIPKHTQDHGDA